MSHEIIFHHDASTWPCDECGSEDTVKVEEVTDFGSSYGCKCNDCGYVTPA